MTKSTKRGFDQDDLKWFSKEALITLHKAQEEVGWLLDRGYKSGPVINFIGSHYQLASRQRNALQRSASSSIQILKRNSSLLPFDAAREGCICIDGFNLIITLEVALSGSVLILSKDGVIRDLAGLRGTYSLIDKTDMALALIGRCFKELSIPKAEFYLDSPVSNSGRLKKRIFEYAENWGIPVYVELVPNADKVLSNMSRIVTGDSAILDQCGSWINLSRFMVENYIENPWIIDFNN